MKMPDENQLFIGRLAGTVDNKAKKHIDIRPLAV